MATTVQVPQEPLWLEHCRGEIDQISRAGHVSLIEGTRASAKTLLDGLSAIFGTEVTSLSSVGLLPEPARTANELLDRVAGARLLYDLEAICWQPWINADVTRFLRALARDRGVVALWPGSIRSGAATFSAPGRPDHVVVDARGMGVLQPVTTRFPDEVPFRLERIPG